MEIRRTVTERENGPILEPRGEGRAARREAERHYPEGTATLREAERHGGVRHDGVRRDGRPNGAAGRCGLRYSFSTGA